MKKTCMIALAMLLMLPVAYAQCIIPLPVQMEVCEAKGFSLTAQTPIYYNDASFAFTANELVKWIKRDFGLSLKAELSTSAPRQGIFIKLDPTFKPEVRLPEDAYKFNSSADGIEIVANDKGGAFYGAVTLLQAINPKDRIVPALEIVDYPAFPWRGVMLDVSRYFFNKEYVLRYLDMMAMHKLNVFHWHLIDDCGWRIEIKKYPKLTEIGAKRGEGRFFHEGYYTQEDIKEIVQYAAERNIEVVPEIEIPAHTQAALAAYPYLGCFNTKLGVPDRHSISPEIYCAGKETTYDFLEDVLDEVAELFPAKFVHIGGDEARYARWAKCPDCQAMKTKHNLKNESQLQGHMTKRIEKYLLTKDKQIIGWDEILHCGVSNKSGIMTWHRLATAGAGAKAGNPVVMALTGHAYFDTAESRLPGEPPTAGWLAPISLQRAYQWHPVPHGLTDEAAKNILGVNACLWTDMFLHSRDVLHDVPGEGTTRSEDYVDYLSLPRFSSLAEVGWTPQSRRNYADFEKRMKCQYLRYDKAGYNYRMPTPKINAKRDLVSKQLTVEVTEPLICGAVVRYTTDGETPSQSSPILDKKLTLGKEVIFKAATFLPTKQSLTYSFIDDVNKFAKFGDVIGKWEAGKVAAKTPREETFNATGIIDADGEYDITFVYGSGASGLAIEGVEIFRNDSDLVGKKIHEGFAGGRNKNNVYRVKVEGYQTGATFKIKAKICGDISVDSAGIVCIKKK